MNVGFMDRSFGVQGRVWGVGVGGFQGSGFIVQGLKYRV